MKALRQALGAYAVERVDGLYALPDSDRALVEIVHVLRAEQARLDQGASSPSPLGQRAGAGFASEGDAAGAGPLAASGTFAIPAPTRTVKLSRELLTHFGPVQQQSMTVSVGAGVGVGRLEEQLAPHALSLGPLPPGAWDLQLAEFLEGPYAGLRAIAGGRLEPICAQLDGVLADGRRVTTQPGPRSATGPDLAALFLGASGRLGLVTRALVRAVPALASQASVIFSFPSAASAIQGLTLALARGCWLSHARLEERGGRFVSQVHWGGCVGGVERDREVLSRCVEGVGGRPAGELGGGVTRAPDRETTWDEVRDALAKGRPLSLYRLSLASVVARGEVAGVPLERPSQWGHSSALARALDPAAVLGGAP